MKQLYYFIPWVISGLILLVSCGEDSLSPNQPEKNIFLEPYGITGEELALQKSFFETTGSYLLFHDLLDKRYLGRDAEGKEVYEDVMLDLTYAMLSATEDAFEFDYLATVNEKRAAADFIKEKLLPSLKENIRPYSFFLVNKIDHYEKSGGNYVLRKLQVYSGWRATAVAVEGVNEMTEAAQVAYKKELLRSIVNKSISNVDQSVFGEFYAVSSRYYANYSMNSTVDFPELTYIGFQETGLLQVYAYNPPGTNPSFPNGFVNFPAASIDLTNYINLLFTKTLQEVEQENAIFPLVIKKYKILKGVIEELGVLL